LIIWLLVGWGRWHMRWLGVADLAGAADSGIAVQALRFRGQGRHRDFGIVPAPIGRLTMVRTRPGEHEIPGIRHPRTKPPAQR
jgi:hypothetical protein